MASTRGGVQFDAFISYSGSASTSTKSFDRLVAERLHRLLEKYRAPRSLRISTRRLHKVFLDREELQASSSLHHSLEDALHQSRFLIVICSPRAKCSQWVREEIRVFRGLDRGNFILPVLIEGEPEDSFPEELCPPTQEGSASEEPAASGGLLPMPLAADVRAASPRESLRRLRKEKLRILSPLLGCSYDDLHRREHQRSVRRLWTAGLVLSLTCILLTSLSVGLYYAKRRADRNYQLALEAETQILPLVLDTPEDLPRKEMYLLNAVATMEELCNDDPRNVHCLENLQGLQGALMQVQRSLGREGLAEKSFLASKSLVAPIAVRRLRAWDPLAKPAADDLFSELPDSHQIKRLRDMLSIWERGLPVRVEDAVTYSEYASEYIELLDASQEEDRAEVRRVLQHARALFEQVEDPENLNEQHQTLMGELLAASQRIPGM